MKLPAHHTIDIAPDEARRLEAVRREFLTMMQPLDGKQRMARAEVIAGGLRPTNPYTRALAQQFVDIEKLNREAVEAQSEIDEIAAHRRLKGFDPAPALVARKVALEDHIARLRARQVGIVENDLGTAKAKAVVRFREEAASSARQERLAEAIARQTAEAEQAEIEARAAQVVRGKRIGAGKQPSKAGEAQ